MAPNRTYSLLAIFAFLLAVTVPAAAQFEVTVVRVQAADAKAPIAGAMVDLYRIDNGTKLSAATDKNGAASFAGTTAAAEYIVVASAAKFDPNFIPRVRAGQEGIILSLAPGSGKRPNAEEVKSALTTLATGVGGQLTEEQKAIIQKEQAAAAAIEAKNSKSKADFEVARKLNDEARAAFEAKNYTLAISKSDEAITAVPEFVGITPRFLLYRGASYRDRAAEAYNKAALDKALTPVQKAEVFKAVRSDLVAAVGSFSKAWTLLNGASVNDPQLTKTVDSFKEETSANAMSALKVAVQAKQVDAALSTAGKGFLTEYIGKQADATKKGEALILLGGLLYQTDDYDGSVVEYRRALELLPENPDALFGISIALITSGSVDNNKAKYQEAANYLSKFETVAKGNPKYAALVEEVPGQLAALKAMDVVPEKPKAAPAGRRKT